jgi:hypothetical protein
MYRKTIPAFAAAIACTAAHAVAIGGDSVLYHELANVEQTGGNKYLDSERAVLPRLQLAASRQGSIFGLDNVFTSVSLGVQGGLMNYDGYTIDLASATGLGKPITNRVGELMLDGTVKVGRAFSPFSTVPVQFTPYLSYGAHYWVRGTMEHYSFNTATAGLMVQYAITTRTDHSADVSCGKTFGGMVHAVGDGGVDERLASRPYRAASIGIDYALSRRTHITGSYQVASYAFGQSAVATGYYRGMYGEWYEPTSRTIRQTVMVGIAHSF